MSTSIVHPLHTRLQPPRQFTYPFCYEPHPLCLKAAAEVQRYIVESGVFEEEQSCGKMFGVLVVETGDQSLAFIAAYSGLLAGRNDWPYFVPPVFDAQRPDGHFKRTEREISALNREIAALETDTDYREAVAARQRMADDAADDESRFRAQMAAAKERRDARRRSDQPLDDERLAMTRESQYMKAELRRRRAAAARQLAEYDALHIRLHADRIAQLQQRRRTMSDDLQLWLFRQYRVLNAQGEERDLIGIFRDTVNAMPPAGAGDCCAPKLMQYAYMHGLRPVCMAEFWWGESPRREIRHHRHYYPACRSKCLPILTHMLRGLDVEPNPLAQPRAQGVPRIIYEDAEVIVVDKPAGMLSVPGKDGLPDVETFMNERMADGVRTGNGGLGQSVRIRAVHRLDMDTSGLLVLARTDVAYRELQRQFAARETRKHYEAVLDGVPDVPESGTISLPLRADINDRPRQCVDRDGGKAAVTDYRIISSGDGRTLVSLWPHTGRTHQLRVHCAHAEGLGCPILGDPLYGRGTAAERMCLHAAELELTHPATGERLHFESPSGF